MHSGKTAIIIFVRNPEPGKVKTRLAASIGEEKALRVYRLLLRHTLDVVRVLGSHKYVFYAGAVNRHDAWHGAGFFKKEQQGNDLGSRMKNAFSDVLGEGYERVVIIGSDCYELTPEMITAAFHALAEKDVVIGPALDGGYYLLGMKKLYKSFFEDKSWSTSTVFTDTVNNIEQLGLSYAVLPALNDVDEEKDITFPY